MKQRILAFDALKLFAIYLVLWGHAIQYLQSNPYYENFVYRMIYSFHMPLFMMISGYFSVSSMEMTFILFVRKKFVQLLWPSIVWSIVGGGFLWKSLSVAGHIMNDYWFLKSLFICYIIIWLGIHSKLKEWQWVITALLITQFVDYFKISLLFPCFLMGYLIRKYNNLRNIVSNLHFVILGAFCFFCFLFLWDESFWRPSPDFKRVVLSFCLNGEVHTAWLYRVFFPTLIGTVGSIFFIGLFINRFGKLEGRNLVSRIIADWGKETLGIYLIQAIILETLLPQFLSFDYLNEFCYSFFVTPMIALVIMIICIAIIKGINNSIILRFLLLGKNF